MKQETSRKECRGCCNETTEKILALVAFWTTLALVVAATTQFIPLVFEYQRLSAVKHEQVVQASKILAPCAPVMMVLENTWEYCHTDNSDQYRAILLKNLEYQAIEECASLNATQLIQDVFACRIREAINGLDYSQDFEGWMSGLILSGCAWLASALWMQFILFEFTCCWKGLCCNCSDPFHRQRYESYQRTLQQEDDVPAEQHQEPPVELSSIPSAYPTMDKTIV